MTDQLAYQAMADAFHAEGVDTQFVLTGDGNMHWSVALSQKPGVQTIHVRHEHCAVAAATAYALAQGQVGVASVTCGPGLTQIITALPAAVRARVPLVIMAGEPPLHAKFYNQDIDQAPLVTATGAQYIQAHSLPRLLDHVRDAFHTAVRARCPVVLGVPYDLQKSLLPAAGSYLPGSSLIADGGRPHPDPEYVEQLVDRLIASTCPVLIGGRGALRSGATASIVALADQCGALLGNTLPVRGLFDDHPFSLGVIGGYASETARAVLSDADLVISFGASLSYYTQDAGKLFANATVAQVDTDPRGLHHGLAAASLFLNCDAEAGARSLAKAMDARVAGGAKTAARCRTPELRAQLATAVADSAAFEIAPGVVDPRAAIAAIDQAIPKDWDFVTGSGHQAYFNSQVRGRPPERFLTVREFGAIGNGLSYAIGVAAARRQGRDGAVVLIEGDGGVMMHIQELETIQRLGLRMLICVINDGAYGSEIHKLRADGLDDAIAVFGRTAIHDIARGFGLRGFEVTDLSELPERFAAFAAQDIAEVWNIQVSDQVTAPTMRSLLARGHGVM